MYRLRDRITVGFPLDPLLAAIFVFMIESGLFYLNPFGSNTKFLIQNFRKTGPDVSHQEWGRATLFRFLMFFCDEELADC